ncbi:MAG: hypothetical protein FD180_1695, partial [Planctomycetota bacterium]
MRPIALLVFAASLAIAEDSENVTRTHDVRALLAADVERPGPRLELRPRDAQPEVVADGSEGMAAFTGDTLEQLIRTLVEPESWEDADGVCLEISGDGWMTVKHTRQVQAKIAAALNVLARAGARRVVVDAEVMLLAPGVLEAAGIEAGALTEAQELSLRETAAGGTRGRTVAVLRTGGSPGLRFHAADVRQRRLLTDYDIEIAQAAAVADPVSTRVLDGAVLDVRPTLAPDGATVLLEIRFTCARPGTVREFDAKAKPEGKIQQPARAFYSAAGTWPCPSGRAVLLAPGGVEGVENGWSMAVIVRTKRVEEPLGDLNAGGGDLKLRFLEAGSVIIDVPDFRGRRLELQDEEPNGGIPFIVEPRNPGLSPDQVRELLKRATGDNAAWEVEGHDLGIGQDRLIVVASQGLLEATEVALKGMAEARLRRVAVDAVVVALDGRERGDLSAAALLAAARKSDR